MNEPHPTCATILALALALMAASWPGTLRAAFHDDTAGSGLLWYQASWGAALVDVDRDGDLDLYAGHHYFDPKLHWNDGTGFFDVTTYPQPWTDSFPDRHGMLAVPLGPDEHPDLFIAHGAGGGAGAEPNELYRNDGNGSLTSIGGASGLFAPTGRGRCASAVDYDGDFRVDVWVGNAPDATHRNALFRNAGTYAFVDVAPAVGLDESDGAVGGIWGDFDGDDDPDLLVGGEEFPRPTRLHRNDGGTFSDASTVFSPPLPVVSGADWGDFDVDGDLDLAVCDGQIGIFDTFAEGDTLSYFFNTRYQENGFDGITIPSTADTLFAELRIRGFFDYTKIFLGPNAIQPQPAAWIALTDDLVGEPTWNPGVDQGTFVWRRSPGGPWELRCSTPMVNFDAFDGRLRDGGSISSVTPHEFEDANFTSGGPRVWRNDGGTFAEVTDAMGLPAAMVNPRHVTWVDYDNDGDLDLHVVDMGTSVTLNAPDRLFRNDGTDFADVTQVENLAAGGGGLGDGAVWGDVDRDGDLDVFVAQGAGPVALGGAGPARYYRNDGAWPPSLQLSLIGRGSGAAALGAKVSATVEGRTVVRYVSANSWRGFSGSRDVHVGLGEGAVVESLVIEWPLGTVDTYANVAPGFYHVTENDIALAAPGTATRAGAWRIESVHPQPARGAQSVRMTVNRTIRLDVRVYDLGGRLVRTLHQGRIGAGGALFTWDGRDAGGSRVASGVYFVQGTDGRSISSAKAVRVR